MKRFTHNGLLIVCHGFSEKVVIDYIEFVKAFHQNIGAHAATQHKWTTAMISVLKCAQLIASLKT